MKLNKLSVVLLAMFIAVFAASSAMAYTLNARSEEMTANSSCDFAGTITITFTEDDYNIISAYLANVNNAAPQLGAAGGATGTKNAVVIRVSLSGTDTIAGADVPLLCKDIVGTANPNGAADTALPTNMAVLDLMGVEVSDVTDNSVPASGNLPQGDGTPDVTAYVKGIKGQQFFTIYVTDIQRARDWDNENTQPSIKIGLYDEVIDTVGAVGTDLASTAICADVHDFSGLSKLTVSINNEPVTLTTTTSDNQIGHFLVASVQLRDCDKTEDNDCTPTDEIQLCPLESTGQTVSCPNYTTCFVAEGDLPTTGDITITLRTNGASDGDNTQSGIYFENVIAYNEGGTLVGIIPTFYEADGTTVASNGGCEWEAEQVTFTVNTAELAGGNELRFCVTYDVNPDQAAVNTKVRMWVDASTLPCGSLISDMHEAADLFECGGVPSCMYFPYTVSGISPWVTGVVITNLSSDVNAANMEATFTLTDATGATFTATKSDFDAVVWSFTVDDVLDDWGWAPAAGNAWLRVETNFTVDGYSFLTNGAFGAGTLPRLLESCTSYDNLK